ncbi:MAG: glutamine--tRNA ligase, partial [Phycisphaerales bacterium]|nr:glutamine--tRNA ligase [Phycisphaerales bacterium]
MSRNFIQQIVDAHIESGRWGPPGERNVVCTRFPPEPNGYMHIGHAKSIYLNHGLAQEYGGRFFLRFDDTNPVKEEAEFVESIQRDIAWLGYNWDDDVKFASDYFEAFYEYACTLIRKGVAYVDDQTPDQIRDGRGTLQKPGVESPWRDRDPAESLDLFQRMRAGEFPDGSRVLRARIDMASPNMNLRDPVMYRILHAHHHRTGDAWCIYPMYDWAHGLEDSVEGITHSICTLEFENHRPLYDWFLEQLEIHHPQQIEFAGLAL